MWCMAPNRSHGAAHKFSWQNRLQSLPGNVFDVSTPVHKLTMGARTGSFFMKLGEIGAVGMVSGLSMAVLSNLGEHPHLSRHACAVCNCKLKLYNMLTFCASW